MGASGAAMTAATMLGIKVYVILKRMLVQSIVALALAVSTAVPAAAQADMYRAKKARRHFVSVTYDWQYIQPYGFDAHPLAQLLGQPVTEVHLQPYQYDGQTRVFVNEFSHQGQAVGVTLYPLGSSDGATLAIRGSIEKLPTIQLAFDGPAPAPAYLLTGGRAYDLGFGIDMSDRSPGWGLGSHAFVLGGFGKATSDQGNGRRYFAEGGGGLLVGPFGVDLSFKFAVNRFDEPVPHSIYDIPISVRGTLTF
jgi:hypothetical protein